MKNKKEKKQIAPNECSLLRWIAVLVTGLVIGLTLDIPLNPYMENRVDSIMGISYADFFGVLSFIPLFLGMALALWLVGKTSLKNFILGVGGTVNKRVCLTVLGIFAAGFAIPYLLTAPNLRLRGAEAGQFAFLILFMLLTTWIQTTWEELIFRGLFIRWACKNNVRYTKKALITGAVSSLAFALSHVANPEVTSQSGFGILLVVAAYTIPGFVCYLADLHFGSLLPGIIVHWLNNFILFTLVSSEVSVVALPTLLIDTTPNHAAWTLGSTALAYLPLLVYILWDGRKRTALPLSQNS